MFNDKKIKDWILNTHNYRDAQFEQSKVLEMHKKYAGPNIKMNSHWNMHFSEFLVEQYLSKNDDKFTLHKNKKYCVNNKNYIPDFSLVNKNTGKTHIFEVKCQSHSISGTAHEKVLGTIYKYLPIVDKLENVERINVILTGYIEVLLDNLTNPTCTSQCEILKVFSDRQCHIFKFSNIYKTAVVDLIGNQ